MAPAPDSSAAKSSRGAGNGTGNGGADGVGATLRYLRLKQGLTLDDVSRRAKLTRGFVSKIERGKASPPIATLLRLATALGVDPAAFFAGGGGASATGGSATALLVRRGDRTRMDDRGGGPGYNYEALAARRTLKLMEPFLITVRPEEADFNKTFRHPGEEFVFVLEGKMDYRVGDELFALGAGDSLYFDATRPHAPLPRDGAVSFLAIFCAPPRPAAAKSPSPKSPPAGRSAKRAR